MNNFIFVTLTNGTEYYLAKSYIVGFCKVGDNTGITIGTEHTSIIYVKETVQQIVGMLK